MVLDDPSQVCLTRRLRRDNMDGCLKSVETAMIAVGRGEPLRFYVGGILYGELWASGQINREDKDKPYLEPPIRRIPLWQITSYELTN